MHRIAVRCADVGAVGRFPSLHAKVVDTVGALLETGHRNGKEMVSNLIKCELSWLNTNHPNFIGGSRAVLQVRFLLKRGRAPNAPRAPTAAKLQDRERGGGSSKDLNLGQVIVRFPWCSPLVLLVGPLLCWCAQAMTRLQEERAKQRERQALLRARTLGIFGNPDRVEEVLQGDAQG